MSSVVTINIIRVKETDTAKLRTHTADVVVYVRSAVSLRTASSDEHGCLQER